MVVRRYKMTWRGIGSSSWSSTHSPPLQMLIIRYLLLAAYFVTQVAILAAPIPSDSAPSRNINPSCTKPPKVTIPACTNCRRVRQRCDEERPCLRCIQDGCECVIVELGPPRKNGARNRTTQTVCLFHFGVLFSPS